MEEEQKEEIFQAPSEFQSRISRNSSGSSSKKYFAIVAAIVVVLLLILGVSKFLGGSKKSTTTMVPTPTQEAFPTDTPTPTEAGTPTPTEKPSATPKPTTTSSVDKATGLDRAKLSIHILNGSGTAGASKKASDFLEGLGYNIVQIGNADNFDYANTQVQVKSGKSNYLSLLKKDLSANYTLGSSSSDLGASESADAVVIIGKQ